MSMNFHSHSDFQPPGQGQAHTQVCSSSSAPRPGCRTQASADAGMWAASAPPGRRGHSFTFCFGHIWVLDVGELPQMFLGWGGLLRCRSCPRVCSQIRPSPSGEARLALGVSRANEWEPWLRKGSCPPSRQTTPHWHDLLFFAS